jgi:hypothetical protein
MNSYKSCSKCNEPGQFRRIDERFIDGAIAYG